MSYALAQMDRILANLIRFGRIYAVDLDAGTATVDFDGELVSDLEWAKSRAGEDRSWNGGYSKGEQVVVLSPSGDLSQGVIAFSLSQTAFPNAGTTENPKHIYADGTVVEYDKVSHTLNIDLSSSGGKVFIKGGLVVNGEAEFNGPDVKHKGKSIGVGHTHNRTQPGNGDSGEVN
ncbi:hypothetical protein B9T25_12945 [Acinetobacter sp. ANC 4470]|uniref:phage baseplate assembly protein V n=1 Tax=Acinetobacter sp. ANC 4470 TaxID=1977881 RepID=UPI000A34717E|nr:phage baseplate assembly protein V [Acinetobacter sp. ANC 4470]OTG64341.1 hypothetical protein B9T25_12945 [Acinetobacter sp. ANC 4470]